MAQPYQVSLHVTCMVGGKRACPDGRANTFIVGNGASVKMGENEP
jgi:hypothetical protein